MRSACSGLLLMAAAATALASQGPPPPPPPPSGIGIQLPPPAQVPTAAAKGTGLVLGQVLDGGSGKPVAGAVVTLTGSRSTPADLAAVGLLPFEDVPVTGPGPTVPTRMMTDGDGRFVFRELAAGRYTFSATAPGYISGSYGQRRPGGPSASFELAEGEKQRDVVFRLWKSASMSGSVLDETGEPVVGITVRALRRMFSGGRRRWIATGPTTTTDDRGMYRVPNLPPGDYTVSITSTQSTIATSTADAFMDAMRSGNPTTSSQMQQEMNTSNAPSPMMPGVRVGDFVLSYGFGGRTPMPPSPDDAGKILVYQDVYYPTATSVSQASVITLGSGDERGGLDLQLRLVTTVRVSGSVTGPDGPVRNIGVRLLPASVDEFQTESNLDVASTITDATGAFTFLGVQAGAYVLKILRVPRPSLPTMMSSEMVSVGSSAGGISFGVGMPTTSQPPPPPLPTDPTLWATLPVSVADTDVGGLAVTLRTGARVTGRVEFDGQKPKPTAAQLQRMSVTLAALEARPLSFGSPGRVNADGTFSTLGYPPGRYLVSATSGGAADWTFRSAIHGGRDVSDEPLEITGNDVGGIVLTFSDQPTELSGTVLNAKGQPDADADVVIFPANHESWKEYGVSIRHGRSVRTSIAGTYNVPSLAPGDYYIAAVSSITTGEWQDPRFLEAAKKIATRITLANGEKKVQDLRTGAVR